MSLATDKLHPPLGLLRVSAAPLELGAGRTSAFANDVTLIANKWASVGRARQIVDRVARLGPAASVVGYLRIE